MEPELKWGFSKDWEIGVGSENLTRRDGAAKNRFGDSRIHLLHNLNQEGENIPAMALRPELSFGTGAFGREHLHAGLKGIVSKTLGMDRIHLNGSYTLGPTEAPGRGSESVSRSLYGIAYERTFPMLFVVLLADLHAVRPIEGGRTGMISDLGGGFN